MSGKNGFFVAPDLDDEVKENVPVIEEYGKAVNAHADRIEQAGAGI